MMHVGMRSPGPGTGFGAAGVDPTAAARPANQVERGRAKDRSFDDQLGDCLAAAADDKDREAASADAVVPQGSGAQTAEKPSGRSADAPAAGDTKGPLAEGDSMPPLTEEAGTAPGPGIAGLGGGEKAQPQVSPAASPAANPSGPAANAAVGTPPGAPQITGLGDEANAAAVETPISEAIDDDNQGDASSVEHGAQEAKAQPGSSTSFTRRSAAAAAGYAVAPAEQSVHSADPALHAPANVTKHTEAVAAPEPTVEAPQPKLDQLREAAVSGGDPGTTAAGKASGPRSFDTSSQGRNDDANRSFAENAIPLVSELTGEAVKAALPDLQVHAGPDVAGAPAESAVRVAVPASLGAFQVTQIPGYGVAAPVPAPASPLPAETASSIIQSIRMQYQAGGGDAIVHIKPEHLGPVSVSLRVENGVVSAVVTAENPAVAEWLKANEHMLRDGLSSSGLHLERFAVRRDGHPAEDEPKGYRQPEPKERRRRLLQPESTFEVTV